jgi:uncharacterized protein YegL
MSEVQSSDGYQILPFYIVLDESSSMDGPSIDAVNAALPELHAAIAADPNVCDKTSVSIITFSDSAQVLVPLTRMDDLETMPGVIARGSTNYGAAFDLLRSQIEEDVTRLKAQSANTQVLRPACFFISDGEPTDSEAVWQASHSALTAEGFRYRPHIISFGVAKANRETILSVATAYNGKRHAFLAAVGASPGTALREIIRSLTNSIVYSARSTTPQLQVPQNVPGVIPLETV